MERYFEAKSRLISHLSPDGIAVVSADDPQWKRLPRAPRTMTFGRVAPADVSADAVHFTPRGSEWRLVVRGQRHTLRLPLIGDFNVDNALAAAAAAQALGLPLSEIARRLSTTPQVPGRLEVIHEHPTVLRDYAHTPDALERALQAVRPFTRRNLIVVFGAGGDRDRGKRPLMGAIAERNADTVILTSDNPRTEDPDAILDDIERGMRRPNHERYEDREEAIVRAMALAADHPADDVVLLAGKGHETYQVRGTTKHPFDEREIVRAIAKGAA
jgi:UDP-N-acetylmuramoyl-L-alanyl-D-glutamate--2,6-diaminopimelate ligase